jgi:hypothetical protein
MTGTEGTPTPQSTRWEHLNTIYLSDSANGTAHGSLTLMAQQMATLKACLADLDGNAEGHLLD